MFVIEKNVPITGWSRGQPSKYPLAQMEKGDSFAVPVEPQGQHNWEKAFARVSNAAYSYCLTSLNTRGYGSYFVIRKDRPNNTIRVWRIK